MSGWTPLTGTIGAGGWTPLTGSDCVDAKAATEEEVSAAREAALRRELADIERKLAELDPKLFPPWMYERQRVSLENTRKTICAELGDPEPKPKPRRTRR